MKKYLIVVGAFVLLFIVSLLISGTDYKKMVLKIEKNSIPKEIKPGDIFTIELDTNLDKNNIQFSSSDESIAAVNNEGLVTVLSKGNVKITVSTVYEEDNPKFDTVTLKVKG